jgi:nucleoside-diphosphate-sugar epimerase
LPGRPLRALILGGTGTISAACARLAVSRGTEVTVFNRARSSARHLPAEVERLTGDIRNPRSLLDAVRGRDFDVVVNFLCFSATEAQQAVEVFEGRTRHYLHISTAQLYQKPPWRVPYTESSARRNPFSAYARDKIAAEDVLNQAYTERSFPVTVVRPSHTYDEAQPPVPGDWTVIDRLATGKEIVVPGDGTSLWALTHASDFAQGLVGLFANPSTFGESFHITSDDVYSWDQIYSILADAFHVEARLVHVPSELISRAAPDWNWSEGVMGDLRYSVFFDNSKIRRYVPSFAPSVTFPDAAFEFCRWRRQHPAETTSDPVVDQIFERLVRGYRAAEKIFSDLAPAWRDGVG